MEQENVIELLERAGFSVMKYPHGGIEIGYCCTTIGDELLGLIRLVEQETLERAANQFRAMCDDSYISKDRAISEIEELHAKD